MDYTYTYSSGSGDESGAAALVLITTVLLFSLFFVLIFYVFFAICMAKIFKKAGEEGWKAWIPIYSTWTLYEIVGRPTWWVFLNFIPFFGVVFIIIAYVDIAKSFGKEASYSLLMLLLPIIGLPMLAFGDSRYVGPAGPEKRANWNPNPTQPGTFQAPEQPGNQPPVI